ncbi:glycine receptor subunit alpha-2-like [Lineus longissimus]|uniref:glycine receptor subunit alpha-2-like n=1 Tax=Lineus longissimus TaxID=88925 RepID=UPI00315DE025
MSIAKFTVLLPRFFPSKSKNILIVKEKGFELCRLVNSVPGRSPSQWLTPFYTPGPRSRLDTAPYRLDTHIGGEVFWKGLESTLSTMTNGWLIIFWLGASTTQLCHGFAHITKALRKRDYDKYEHPTKEEGTATSVQVGIYIHSIGDIDEKNMQLVLDIYLRQEWFDERLRGLTRKQQSLHGDVIDDFWLPDPYLPAAKRVTMHEVMTKSRSLHVEPSGQVKLNVRLILELSCHMNFVSYPFDDQLCPVTIESYSLTSSELVYMWSKSSPIAYNEAMVIPKFELSGLPTASNYSDDDVFRSAGGSTVSGIRMDIRIHRELAYYLAQIYFPSALVVILSWVSFIISVEAVPARVTIGLLSILTITTQNMNANKAMPQVSYIKALDIWLTVCLAFVIFAFLEFALVSSILKKHQRDLKKIKNPSPDRNKNAVPGPESFELVERARLGWSNHGGTGKVVPPKHAEEEELMEKTSKPSHAEPHYDRADNLSRIIFPVTFLIFTIVYWVTFLNVGGAENQQSE